MTKRPKPLILQIEADTARQLSIAAKAHNQSLRQFVVQSALLRAAEVLRNKPRFRLSAVAWQAFLSALDEPPESKPRLKRLLKDQREFE